MPTHTVQTSDGRDLQVLEGGAPDGVPVVIHHGTPGGAGLHSPWVQDAAAKGLRLISFSRPGYGTSTRLPGRRVADIASDVERIADELGLGRFLTWGISGGGPHALACAALLPDRVVAAGSLAAIGPYGADGLDFFAGMGPGNVEEFGLAVEHGQESLRERYVEQADEFRQADVAGLVAAMQGFLSEVDARELTLGLGEYLLASTHVGLEHGVDGWLDDDFTQPWGFDVRDIRVPVLLWQGREDEMVPYAHGEWLATQIPGVEAHLSDEDGHLTLITRRVPEVHAWLLQRWVDAPGTQA
jgi:pimeloyl-ACP methyl ester carboxylesterase